MTEMIRAAWARRELRFLVIGGVNTLLGLGLFTFFHELLGDDVPYLVLLVPTNVIGVPIAFALQRVYVFDVHGGSWLLDFARYTFVQLGSIGLNALLLWAFVELLDLPVLLAQTVTLAVIIVTVYFSHLLFSFRRPTV